MLTEHIARNVARVREQCAAAAAVSGRHGTDVTILAATKYVDASAVAALVANGIDGVAENRLDSLLTKRGQLPDIPRECWHYIGRLQSRKVADIAAAAGSIHSLCSMSAANRIASWVEADDQQRHVSVFLQVNVAGDPAKDGIAADDVEAFLLDLPELVVVDGLMTMPEFAEDPEASRAAFSALRELRNALRERWAGRHPLAMLSMGTSQDWTVAVEEGATHVRLGRVLYS